MTRPPFDPHATRVLHTSPPPRRLKVEFLDATAVDLHVDLSAVTRAFDAVRDALRPVAQTFATAMARIAQAVNNVREAANDPVHVAGLEAMYHVRAAMDPAYPTARSLVGPILSGDAEGCVFLTQENRCRVAAAAIRGWAEYRDTGQPVVAWHRLIGSTTITVGRAS